MDISVIQTIVKLRVLPSPPFNLLLNLFWADPASDMGCIWLIHPQKNLWKVRWSSGGQVKSS